MTAVNAVAASNRFVRPMANKALVGSSWDPWLHRSALGWVGGRYLLQHLLAKV